MSPTPSQIAKRVRQKTGLLVLAIDITEYLACGEGWLLRFNPTERIAITDAIVEAAGLTTLERVA